MGINRKKTIITLSSILIGIALIAVLIYALIPHTSNQAATAKKTPRSTVSFQPRPQPTPTPARPGTPTLERLELVTDQAFGVQDNYVPNSWGVQKSRVIRTSTGDIFTVYTSAGSDTNDRIWHLMHRNPAGGWEELQHGNAGVEPINILRGPHDEIHLFAWPGNNGQPVHLKSTDMGKSFTSETLQGQWIVDQGYSGCSINDKGDIVFFQTGSNQPGQFFWTYYDPDKNQWQFHTTQIDYRYTYAFFFPGDNGDLTITGMRDVKRSTLGYASSPDFDYIFNAIKYFYISDVNHPQLSQTLVKQLPPQNNTDYNITYITDSYIDTQGRTHILYSNLYDGPHHAIIQDGQVIKDVRLNISIPTKMRIIQDTAGYFYIISINGGTINILPGAANDTDGTQFGPLVKINISRYPGCSDDDFCHSPTFTVPRSGNPLTDYIDGTYGNYSREVYFRIRLRGSDDSTALSPSASTFTSLTPESFLALVQEEKRKNAHLSSFRGYIAY